MTEAPRLELQFYRNDEVCDRADRGAIVDLVEAATRATFYHDGLSPEQIAANHAIPAMGGDAALAAASSPDHHLAGAFYGSDMAGFVIATRHAPDDLELDWLMVHPRFHGRGVAAGLMHEGMAWLGAEKPIWLTVLQHNNRAIRFYRKFGFAIDHSARLDRTVPSFAMRRPPSPLDAVAPAP